MATDKEFAKRSQGTLEAAFAEATRHYKERGFRRRVSFGAKPALLRVDRANASTRPDNANTCEQMDGQIIPVTAGARRLALLLACLAAGAALAFLGASLTGSDAWFLAIPAALSAGWLAVADPTRCVPGKREGRS